MRENFGKITMAMMMLPRYRHQTLGDLQHLVLEPVPGAAAMLAAGGIGRGMRVAVLAQNCSDLYELLFACGRIGAIFIPLNWRLTAEEIAWVDAYHARVREVLAPRLTGEDWAWVERETQPL